MNILLMVGSADGREELETKAFIDTEQAIATLRGMGAEHCGNLTILEHRYHTNSVMGKESQSLRLRLIQDALQKVVELVLKDKLPPHAFPGHPELGFPIKSRRELEVKLASTIEEDCGFQTMQEILRVLHMRVRDAITTERQRFTLPQHPGVLYEVERITSYNNKTKNLPPPFMEIEGETINQIAAAVHALGIPLTALSSDTKGSVMRKHRHKKK